MAEYAKIMDEYAQPVKIRPVYQVTKIQAFEPQAAAFADLHKFIVQTGLEKYVACHQMALSDRDGRGKIQLSDGFHSGLGELQSGKGNILVRKLDYLNLPPPDMIKLDVEGHEGYVLQGAKRLLATFRPYLIFERLPVNNLNGDMRDIIEELRQLDYDCLKISFYQQTLQLKSIPFSSHSAKKQHIFAYPKEKRLAV